MKPKKATLQWKDRPVAFTLLLVASSSTNKGMLKIGPRTLLILSCTETIWRPYEFSTYLAYSRECIVFLYC